MGTFLLICKNREICMSSDGLPWEACEYVEWQPSCRRGMLGWMKGVASKNSWTQDPACWMPKVKMTWRAWGSQIGWHHSGQNVYAQKSVDWHLGFSIGRDFATDTVSWCRLCSQWFWIGMIHIDELGVGWPGSKPQQEHSTPNIRNLSNNVFIDLSHRTNLVPRN